MRNGIPTQIGHCDNLKSLQLGKSPINNACSYKLRIRFRPCLTLYFSDPAGPTEGNIGFGGSIPSEIARLSSLETLNLSKMLLQIVAYNASDGFSRSFMHREDIIDRDNSKRIWALVKSASIQYK
jgi:hypothetical protein